MRIRSASKRSLIQGTTLAVSAFLVVFSQSTDVARGEGLLSGSLFEFSGGSGLSPHNVLSKAPRIGVDSNSKALDLYNAGDFEGALKLWKAAAEKGDIFAQWKLAKMYRFGQGVDVDEGMAWKYYSAVAKKFDGDRNQRLRFKITVDSIYWIAYYLSRGIPEAGIKKSSRNAFAYFRRSANNMHPAAQYEVGRHYLSGTVVRQNNKTGKQWLFLAARKGYAPAMALLGTIYWSGKIVHQNKVSGLKWYTLAKQYACPSINPEIFDKFEGLYTEATPEERSKAEAAAYKWNQENSVDDPECN